MTTVSHRRISRRRAMAMARPACIAGPISRCGPPTESIPGGLAPDPPPIEGRSSVSTINALQCRECGRAYEPRAVHVCEFCFGPLEVQFDYQAIRDRVSRESIAAGPDTLWRYADLLPVDGGWDPDWPVGMTPLQRAHNLGERLAWPGSTSRTTPSTPPSPSRIASSPLR